ncbi:uncharacterized protein LOC124309873 [Neodiprion virginianus]|uniref:Uncharacterized protein LOC107224055 isoform X2 n=1 Tax=Neodiprion lecontei TaxID=441921 RepID=A0ABM3GQZ7_NEOLC|nr:uncharacterized protein LOC107224055 isoform X2 [Neodiprion lecontei]XP_046610483.1 uncharacterized protein LOC124300430 [Neodiprion virginianus]XP_046610974.1 uncharacterized protein LOC124300693 [Neodiprion virginianus]XP_046629522.1 uncharacterized protein LOC124309873 [Neodiprion virginianus]
MEKKAKFYFVSEAGIDSAKSTAVKVKKIQLLGQEESFLFPADKQTRAQHDKLFENAIVKNVVKSLKQRNKFRNVVLTLSEELENIYLDEEGNVVFHDEYLEEDTPMQEASGNREASATSERKTSSLVKDMVVEKFNGENMNASNWMRLYVQECDRVGIAQNKYAEVLRLFLEKGALDWYSVSVKQISLLNWEAWNNSFIDTFAAQSWVDIEYAYNFKFYSGSLLEYALKKRSLLLEADDSLSVSTQINMIVISLPKFIQNKLDRKSIGCVDSLMSKLKQIGKISDKKNENVNKKSSNEKRPCSICEKLGYRNRFHLETVCHNKDRQSKNPKNENIRVTNNNEVQEILARQEESKND